MSYNLNKSECESVARYYVNQKTKEALQLKEKELQKQVEKAYNSVFTPNLLELLQQVQKINDKLVRTSRCIEIQGMSSYEAISSNFEESKFVYSGRITVQQPLFEEAKLAHNALKTFKQEVDTATQTLSASLYKIKNIEKIEVQFPEITETLKALQLDIKTKQSKLPSIIDKDVINNIEKLSKI